MTNDKFLHCLRIQIFPGHYEDERIENVVSCAEKYGFNNVMLFINAEEYFLGHMTRAEAEPYLATIKRAKKALEAKGISVSLNPWIELGHLDRAPRLKEEQDFTTMTDFNGGRSNTVACPLCESWWKYFSDFYTYLLTEVRPHTIWIEDDFRLHNHAPLEFGGCFCPLHMKKYSEHMGIRLDRESFVSKLFSGDEAAKRAWLDVNRECMSSLAGKIGRLVREVSPETRVGLMSSGPENHAAEGRDWHTVHENLAAGGEMIDRIHLPYTYDKGAKSYLQGFNSRSMAVRTLIPEECTVYPEIENAVFSTYYKDPQMLRFQVESALALGIKGMTYDIYDFVGNGVVEEFGYGEALRDVTPYLNGVMKLGLHPRDMEGIALPIDGDAAYYKKNVRSMNDLKPDEFGFYGYLSTVGLSCGYTLSKSFKQRTVALAGGTVDHFTDAQLSSLFENNRVILEGGAAVKLIERGLGGLIGAESAEIMRPEIDPYSFEGSRDGITVGGIKGRRATAFRQAGKYVRISYSKEPRLLTDLCDYRGEPFGPGIVRGENFLLIPFIFGSAAPMEQFNHLRTLIIEDFVSACDPHVVMTRRAGVSAYTYKTYNSCILFLANATESPFRHIELDLSEISDPEILTVDRLTGELSEVSFSMKGDKAVLDPHLDSLATKAFVIRGGRVCK